MHYKATFSYLDLGVKVSLASKNSSASDDDDEKDESGGRQPRPSSVPPPPPAAALWAPPLMVRANEPLAAAAVDAGHARGTNAHDRHAHD